MCIKRRVDNKSSEENSRAQKKHESFRVPRTNPRARAVVEAWVKRALDMGVQNLVYEFRDLAKWCSETMTINAFLENKTKNRYEDVPCQDARRVILKWPGLQSDYIHANYVATPTSDRRFICTQGPLESTLFDFWAMVVQEGVENIVMLCNTIENGKFKCHQYYPLDVGGAMSFVQSNFEITVANLEIREMSEEDPFVKVCKLRAQWKNSKGEAQDRIIFHYQWENWPDRGVPPCKFTAVNILTRVRGSQKPILVHCSAGIGRTGTVVAVAYVQEKMQAGHDCMDTNDLLKELRSQRPFSIQNEYQYIYLHRVLLAYFLEKYSERHASCLKGENAEKYRKWVEDYEYLTSPN